MPKPRSTKRDIDRAKRERAEAKREKRQADKPGETSEDPDRASDEAMPEQEVLAALDELHGRFDAGDLDFDEFSVRKADLLNQLAAGGTA